MLKAMLQVAAASVARCPHVHYLTFGDDGLANGINTIVHGLRSMGCTVGQLVKLIMSFSPHRAPHGPERQAVPGYYADLFAFLRRRIDRVAAQQPQQPQPQQEDEEKQAAAAPVDGEPSDRTPAAPMIPTSALPPLEATPPTRSLDRHDEDGDTDQYSHHHHHNHHNHLLWRW